MKKQINKMFNLLEEYKGLPKYQLERRVDIFFAYYLPIILEKKFGGNDWVIIPEFPIKKENNQSTNMDYLAFNINAKLLKFIELKTDNNSINPDQIEYYKNITRKELISNIETIKKASKQKAKYDTLLEKVTKLKIPEMKDNGRKDVVYILPKEKIKLKDEKFTQIDFLEIANILEEIKKEDYLALRFAKSLKTWSNS